MSACAVRRLAPPGASGYRAGDMMIREEHRMQSAPATVAASRTTRANWLTRLAYSFALLWLLALTFSIAVAEASLWLATAAWGAAWLSREVAGEALGAGEDQRGPAGDVLGTVGAPIIVFFAVSLLSAFLSPDLITGLDELREVFLFAAPLVTWATFRNDLRRGRGRAVFAVGVFLAILLGVYQAAVGTPAPGDAVFRATGPLGHYMTFSGVLLVALPLLLSFRGGWPALAARLVAVLAGVMITLTLTRSAWIGAAVALIVYFATGFVGGREAPAPGAPPGRSGRSVAGLVLSAVIALIVVGLLLISLVDSDALYERAASAVSLEDPSNRDRIAMAAAGLRMIDAYPLLGIGPGRMEEVYPAWKVDWAVNDVNPHLHNNLLQIASERGLLGLAAWLWMMAAFVIVAWRVLRSRGARGPGGAEARAALAALAGFLAMGMFEYNFSDSEVLMALLYVVSLPLAAAAGAREPSRDKPTS